MATINDIWNEMNSNSTVKTLPKKKSAKNKTSTDVNSIHVKITSTNEQTIKVDNIIKYEDMKLKISRQITGCNDENSVTRRNSLIELESCLFHKYKMSPEGYGEVFHDVGKQIFKRFGDPTEKCREKSFVITKFFFQRTSDFIAVLPYFFPALMQRIPSGYAYDEDMKVFVADLESHEAFRRGKAVSRQDKVGVLGGSSYQVVESSEEIRLFACEALRALIERAVQDGSCQVLHAYFQDIIMFLQYQLRDPFGDVKLSACQALEMMAKVADFEVGMKFFSVALVRALLPVLRHRHSKVRIVAVSAMKECMIVPDRMKRKAAGSDAIMDLVGFREENILPIAAFYTADVQLNYLAELVGDKSIQVREKVVELLTSLMTEIDDRFDHHSRLLPYLLDLLTDENETVSKKAVQCLNICGSQYEEDHHDEIIEKRQYGVDGDDRINFSKPLPYPFTERPRIGVRLYVRGNTKRFLSALVNELTNWLSHTRLKSAQLLKIIICLCEENLTMEAHALFPSFIKSLKFAKDDKDNELHSQLLELFELFGRYITPSIYMYYILPRLRGDEDVVAFGIDADTRITVMEFLQALIEGTKPTLLPPFFDSVIDALTDPFVINPESTRLISIALDVMKALFSAMKGKGNQVVESHFVATGRLTTLKNTILKAFKFLIISSQNDELREKSIKTMDGLTGLESDAMVSDGNIHLFHKFSIKKNLHLYKKYGEELLNQLIVKDYNYQLTSDWNPKIPEHSFLEGLLQCPVEVLVNLSSDSSSIDRLLIFLVNKLHEGGTLNMTESSTHCIESFSKLLLSVMQQLVPLMESSHYHIHANLLKMILNLIIEENVLWSRNEKLMKFRLEYLQIIRTFDLSLASSMSLSSIPSSRYIMILIHQLLPQSIQPTFSSELRLKTLQWVEEVIIDLQNRMNISFEKVKNFQFWKTNSLCNESSCTQDLLLYWKLVVQKVIHSVVFALDDNVSSIRDLTGSILLHLVNFVLDDDSYEEMKETAAWLLNIPNNNGKIINDTTGNISKDILYQYNKLYGITDNLLDSIDDQDVVMLWKKSLRIPFDWFQQSYVTSFSFLVPTLIKRLRYISSGRTVDEMNNDADQLDQLLHSMAVLDPTKFSEMVRLAYETEKDLENRKSDGNEAKADLLQFYEHCSGLLNHCDILLKFNENIT